MATRHLYFLVMVAIVPLIVLAWWAKTAASWRPRPVAQLLGKAVRTDTNIAVSATSRYVKSENSSDPDTLLDLKSGARRSVGHDEVGIEGEWVWELDSDTDTRATLELHHGNGLTLSYRLPSSPDNKDLSFVTARIWPVENRVELLCLTQYLRWNKASRQLERAIKIPCLSGTVLTLSRDGESIVSADESSISWISTGTGNTVRRVPLVGFQAFMNESLSPFGSYALYDYQRSPDPTNSSPKVSWHVVDTKTGRIKWSFDMDSIEGGIVLSHDEQLIAISYPSRHIWQVRRLETGEIWRTLPLLSGVRNGAFSPDGALLYSVANGTLYQQRVK